MNTHAEYRRHSHPAHREPPHVVAVASPATGPELTARGTNRIAWVRPTDLTTFASPAIGRGIDLQAELTRRVRRSPVSARRAIRHRHPQPSQFEGTRPLDQQGVEL